jgi:hypothetical protein
MVNAKIGEYTVLIESARGMGHPPVVANMAFKPGQGALPCGLLLEAGPSGLVPHTSGVLVGVNDRAIDTNAQESGLVIIHGSVVRELLKAGAANPVAPDETTLAALMLMGVFPE